MDGKDTGMCSGNFCRKGAILVSTNGILDLLGSAITGSPYSFWMSRLHPQHCNQSSTSWDPHKIFQAYDSELLSDGNRGGAFGCIFLLKLLHCHIFGWEELKKRRDVLSYLKVLLAFAVSSWVCSPLADRCYSPSFTAHIFFLYNMWQQSIRCWKPTWTRQLKFLLPSHIRSSKGTNI